MKGLVIRGARAENATGEGKTLLLFLDKPKSLTNRQNETAKLRDLLRQENIPNQKVYGKLVARNATKFESNSYC